MSISQEMEIDESPPTINFGSNIHVIDNILGKHLHLELNNSFVWIQLDERGQIRENVII